MDLTGTVICFNDIHGDGFIKPDQGTEVVKVTYTNVIKNGFRLLHEGQRVKYSLDNTNRGPVARGVTPLDEDWQ